MHFQVIGAATPSPCITYHQPGEGFKRRSLLFIVNIFNIHGYSSSNETAFYAEGRSGGGASCCRALPIAQNHRWRSLISGDFSIGVSLLVIHGVKQVIDNCLSIIPNETIGIDRIAQTRGWPIFIDVLCNN
ncbi:hypothetical protein S83_062392 [Arachis hypogaea]